MEEQMDWFNSINGMVVMKVPDIINTSVCYEWRLKTFPTQVVFKSTISEDPQQMEYKMYRFNMIQRKMVIMPSMNPPNMRLGIHTNPFYFYKQ
jgi:hypothetical protein